MGDSRRFDTFADLIARNLAPQTAIADVAGGGGGLRAALFRRGYSNIDTWDKRHRNARGRNGYVYGLFDWRSAPRKYEAVVGMHADGGTDHVIMYSIKHRVPFLLCPCCVIPSAAPFHSNQYEDWVRYLSAMAESGRMRVTQTALPIRGRNIVIIGHPK